MRAVERERGKEKKRINDNNGEEKKKRDVKRKEKNWRREVERGKYRKEEKRTEEKRR